MLSSGYHLIRFGTVLGFAVFAFLFQGMQAQAGCGDYVLINGRSAHDVRANTGNVNDTPVSPAPLPCHGPNCSANRPQQSPAAVPASISGTEHETAFSGILVQERDLKGTKDRHPLTNDVLPPSVPLLPFIPPKI